MKFAPALSLLTVVALVPDAIGGGGDRRDPGPHRSTVVDALGGEAAIAGLTLIKIEASGSRGIDYEGLNPSEIVEASTYSSTYWHNLSDDAMRVDSSRTPLFEAFQFFPAEDYTIVLNGDVGGLPGQTGFFPPGPLPSGNVGALKRHQDLFNPHFILRDVLDGTLSASEGDEADVDGRAHRVLAVGDGPAQVRLFIDAESGLISKLETTDNSPLLRDTPIEVRFADWETFGGVSFPLQVELHAAAGLVQDETRTAVALQPADLPAGAFDLPDNAGAPADPAALQWGHDTHQVVEGFFHILFGYTELVPVAASELAPNIQLLSSGHNSVVVRLDDGVVILEGPNSPAQGSTIVSLVETDHPGVDITHVIQSHHHQDHSAGLRSIAAAGATVVVGHGAGSFMETVLAAPSTLRPDALSTAGVTTTVEEVAAGGTFVTGDDNITITAHHVANNPHAEDMVVTVIEANGQRWVYEADLYNAGSGFTLVVGGPEAFFAILKDLELIDEACAAPVPLTIVPAHGVPVTVSDAIAELNGLGNNIGCPE